MFLSDHVLFRFPISRHAVEGEKTLQNIERLLDAYDNVSGRGPRVRITSCHVLRYPRSSVGTSVETFLHPKVPGGLFKVGCANARGKREPSRAPATVGRLRTRAAKTTTTGKRVREIGRRRAPAGKAARPSSRNETCERSESRPGPAPIGVETDADGPKDPQRAGTVLRRPYSSVADFDGAAANPILRANRKFLVKTNDSAVETGTYGSLRLPRDHKDYWKCRKVYESIADE